jgi:hypothetical protein
MGPTPSDIKKTLNLIAETLCVKGVDILDSATEEFGDNAGLIVGLDKPIGEINVETVFAAEITYIEVRMAAEDEDFGTPELRKEMLRILDLDQIPLLVTTPGHTYVSGIFRHRMTSRGGTA